MSHVPPGVIRKYGLVAPRGATTSTATRTAMPTRSRPTTRIVSFESVYGRRLFIRRCLAVRSPGACQRDRSSDARAQDSLRLEGFRLDDRAGCEFDQAAQRQRDDA